MAKQPWWVWAGGGLLLVLLANALLGGAFHLVGIVIGGLFTILKDVVGVAFSLVGAALGSLFNLLLVGGLGFLGYRGWRRWQRRHRQPSMKAGRRYE